MAADTGWTWDYIEDTLTWPRLMRLVETWNEYPPVRVLVSKFLGYKPPSEAKRALTRAEIMGAIGGTADVVPRPR